MWIADKILLQVSSTNSDSITNLWWFWYGTVKTAMRVSKSLLAFPYALRNVENRFFVFVHLRQGKKGESWAFGGYARYPGLSHMYTSAKKICQIHLIRIKELWKNSIVWAYQQSDEYLCFARGVLCNSVAETCAPLSSHKLNQDVCWREVQTGHLPSSPKWASLGSSAYCQPKTNRVLFSVSVLN